MPWKGLARAPSGAPSGNSNAYAAMRQLWFSEKVRAPSKTEDPDGVIAVLVEMPVRDGAVAFVAAADGTASMYTSTGGGIIGMGFHAPTAAAALALVGCAGSYVGQFPIANAFPLPRHGQIAFRIVTPAGVHSAQLSTESLSKDFVYSPLDKAREELVTQARLLDERRQKTGLGPHAVDVQVFADGGACVLVPPHPGGTWLTAAGLARVLEIAHSHKDKLGVFVEPGDAHFQASALRAIEGSPYAGAFSALPQLLGYPDRSTTLHYAAEEARLDLVREQLAHGAPIEARDAAAYTPLLVAAQKGRIAILLLLLQAGADPKARDLHGNTTLMFAAQAGDLAAVKLLLAAGVDPASRGQNGYTALKVARLCGQGQAANYLAALGAPE